MIVHCGWEHWRPYVLRHWLFSFCWYRPVKQIRILGFYLTVSRDPHRNDRGDEGSERR